MSGRRRPPALAVWLLSVLTPAADRDVVLGDLAEEYADRVEAGASGWRAGAAYWLEAMRSVPWVLSLRYRRGRGSRRNGPIRGEAMRSMWEDVRWSWRTLAKRPLLAVVIVSTLAFGIGVNTVVFSLVDGVVLNPFPYPEPDRLVGVGTEYPRLNRPLAFWEVLSPAEYVDIRAETETLRDVAMWDMGHRQVTVGDRTENLFSAFWFDDVFPTLGVRPALGRGFLPEELERGDAVAVVSHRVWRTWLGGDPGVIGGEILVNGSPRTLVGVMPPRTLIYGTDLWLPMGAEPSVFPRGRRQMQLLARLAPGATMEAARAELETLARRTESAYAEQHPEYAGWRLVPMTWTDINVRQLEPAALILTGSVAFVLLLVCVNIASVLLARSAGRQREIAVRTALGAGRGRLVRQLLTESMVLALAGGAVGLGLAVLGVDAARTALGSLAVPVPGEVGLSGRVLAFTAVTSALVGLLFGSVPAWHASRPDVRSGLVAGAGSTGGGGRLRLLRVLVGLEVAIALVLLVGGGLLVNSLVRLNAVDPGFRADRLLTMRLTLAHERYDTGEMVTFLREATRRIEALPGVAGASTATQLPPQGFLRSRFWVEGSDLVAEDDLPTALTTVVGPDYFETMGIPLLRGRGFDERDDRSAPFVAVLNEAAARRYFGATDPVGRRLKLGGADSREPWFEIVGVVGSVANRGPGAEPEPELYASVGQIAGGNQHFLTIRTEADPRSALGAVRGVIRGLDPDQPVYMVRSMSEAFALAMARERLATGALAVLALFALLLAGVGIYGVVAYSAGQRTREIGVRIALGAAPAKVRSLVVRQALAPVALGVAAGLAVALALGRVLSNLLYQVSASDPPTLAAVTLALAAIAALASYLPARRASALDPVKAIREE